MGLISLGKCFAARWWVVAAASVMVSACVSVDGGDDDDDDDDSCEVDDDCGSNEICRDGECARRSSGIGGTTGSGGSGAGPSGGSSGSGGSGAGTSSLDCDALCQELSACPGADPVATCTSDCEMSSTLMAGTPCLADYESYIRCGMSASDICSSDAMASECSAEFDSFYDCFFMYCTANQSAPACNVE